MMLVMHRVCFITLQTFFFNLYQKHETKRHKIRLKFWIVPESSSTLHSGKFNMRVLSSVKKFPIQNILIFVWPNSDHFKES